MKKILLSAILVTANLMTYSSVNIPLGSDVAYDNVSIVVDGKRVIPVMGEIHYSRVPADEWDAEVKKMKEGGINLIATYCFWNHHEEEEGIFDWSGQRNLRRFIEICRDNEMPVIVRLGPFCHGEARNGGIPDWMFKKGCKLRSEQPEFLSAVESLYRQIFTQVQGLQWKDGGPVIGAQFDNEYRGHGSYLMALKKIAKEIGFDLPLYTRTGWPDLATPVPNGEMIPLYGDYADGFWDRTIKQGDGNYYQAFNFKDQRKSTAIATEQLGEQKAGDADGTSLYPYLTCELGSGMATAYHRRPYVYPEDAYAMTIVKLGSGSNMPGYYMYHGGTNPKGKLNSLNENQGTPGTNYNDMPLATYDFQAPLDECGLTNDHYYTLRKLHLFLHDMSSTLAPMKAVFPSAQNVGKDYDEALRWSYRTDSAFNQAFVFINNYQRHKKLSDKKNVRFDVNGVKFPSKPITVPSGTMCIWPVNVAGITYATAQIVAVRDGNVYLEQTPGVATEIAVDGKVLKNLKPKGTQQPVYKNIYLLSSEDADTLFTHRQKRVFCDNLAYNKIKECGNSREIKIGARGVASAPDDNDFENAAVYTISIPAERENKVLEINYHGDCARLYANDNLLTDNFYNGRALRYPLWRISGDCDTLTLKILPIQEDMPIYFSEEADVSKGEKINNIITFSICNE